MTDTMRYSLFPLGRMALWTLLVLGFGVGWVGAARADFLCRAEVDRRSVPQGANLIFTVIAEGDVGWSADFVLPNIPQARIRAGGTNQSMSMVNGQTRTSVSKTWYLAVESPDDFTIDPVVVRTGDGECRTKPIGITVTAPVAPRAIPPVNTGNRLPQPQVDAYGETPGGKPGDDVFVTLDIDQDELYVGQQVVLTFRYWRRIQPWNNPSYSAPRTEGFWREDLGTEKIYRRAVKGRSYTVTEIKYALFPTRSGDLTIEPAELSFPEGVFDRFFNTRRTPRGPNVLRTRSLPVKVKELPQPRPAGFSQIVASALQLRAFADRDSVPRGEAIGLKIQLASDGFLKGFPGLTIPEPPEARMHDAAESFESRQENGLIVGRMAVEKVIIPEADGMMVLPAISLSWFNTTTDRYETATTPALDIVVTPSDRPTGAQDSSGFLRNEISRLGEDLAFIHRVPGSLNRRLDPFTGGYLWWSLLLLPLVLLAIGRWVLERLAAERRDPAGRRRRLALVRAREGLSQAANQSESALRCEALSRVIIHYAADLLDRPAAGITADDVAQYCNHLGNPDGGQRLVAILRECDMARYGGVQSGDDQALMAEVRGLLEDVDNARRAAGRAPSPGVATGLGILCVALALQGTALAQGQVDAGRPGVDPLRLLAEGNQAYTEGRLGDALEHYLTARAQGVNDPVLHFNLGNTQARTGALGEAVASYLRARRLDPMDQDIERNLNWVRRNIKDLELTESELPLFISQIAAMVRAFTLDQWGVFLLVGVWAVTLLVGWGWYRETYGTWLRRGLILATSLVLVTTMITAGRWYVEEYRNVAVVIVPVAEVKSGPADNFPVLFEVHDGLTVTIDSEREGWVRIGMGGDWRGWLPVGSVTRVRMESLGETVQGR